MVDVLKHRFPDLETRRVVVLCGKGNNGGDGFVAARHLNGLGFDCAAVLAGEPSGLVGDARANYRAALGSGVPIRAATTPAAWSRLWRGFADRTLVVDALLGTGLSGPVRGLVARIIQDVNASGLPVVAIDIPSGLSGDSSELSGPAIRAKVTVALCRPKLAHLLPPACLQVGALEVADIGIPGAAVAAVGPKIFSIEGADVRGFLRRRPRDAHKGTFGHVLVVAGSEGKSGAAALAAWSALRAGAGLVTVATPADARAEVASFAPELMTVALPDAPPEATVDRLLAESSGKTAVALGPGLGTDPEIVRWVRGFVIAGKVPLVLDADGLNAFAGAAKALAGAKRTLVLTPHPGEMARLLGSTSRAVVGDRIAAARWLARTARAIVVLKGMATLVASPDGRVFVNRTGNPGMATAGSGDVLAGVLSGLLARGREPLDTVLFGVHLHGRAGDLAAAAIGEEALVSGDIVDYLAAGLQEAAG